MAFNFVNIMGIYTHKGAISYKINSQGSKLLQNQLTREQTLTKSTHKEQTFKKSKFQDRKFRLISNKTISLRFIPTKTFFYINIPVLLDLFQKDL